MIGTRWIPEQIDRAKWRNTIMYRLHSQLQLGVEYNPLADEVGPLGNALLLFDTNNRPAVMLGTSSDRIGTADGPS